MKKAMLIALFAGLSFGAVAQQQGLITSSGGPATGGFSGPKPAISSVEQAKTMNDESMVVLEGSLIKQVGHELYEFRDNSGTVNVDIDEQLWLGQKATPESKVHIEGKVDKEWGNIEIDVKSLRVIQ